MIVNSRDTADKRDPLSNETVVHVPFLTIFLQCILNVNAIFSNLNQGDLVS